jgi:hypothetical protein
MVFCRATKEVEKNLPYAILYMTDHLGIETVSWYAVSYGKVFIKFSKWFNHVHSATSDDNTLLLITHHTMKMRVGVEV